ncbi:unnamed protein product [Meganyctiphanes norvegica]|uniref:Uncharacterized protein n=1 Tax=Meganyctiphanes norvegica TaxID=48144 RepID=A0AAV2PFY5_MEGNR
MKGLLSHCVSSIVFNEALSSNIGPVESSYMAYAQFLDGAPSRHKAVEELAAATHRLSCGIILLLVFQMIEIHYKYIHIRTYSDNNYAICNFLPYIDILN